LDHVVNINDGSEDARPIILRLLPGEETIFNLKVVNHGEPSNISLEASNPVSRSVRLKKPDHYVILEETIPVLVRMPSNKDRLDGEIRLTSKSGNNVVPISLLREPEDPGDDLEDPKALIDADLSDDPDEDEDAKIGAKGTVASAEGDEEEDDKDDEEWMRLEGDETPKNAKKEEEEDEESPRIEFSRHKDVQSYRAASKSAQSLQNKSLQTKSLQPGTVEDGIKGPGPSRDYSGTYQEEYQEKYQEKYEEEYQADKQTGAPGDLPREYQDDQADSSYRYNEYDSNSDNSDISSEREIEESDYDIQKGGVLDILGERAALQIIPAVIFLGLVVMLLLTFFTGTIPEFPGALASSILIVTLIIYGAATLLKA
jgi:hypothetical protein